jgi:TolA-binding protein
VHPIAAGRRPPPWALAGLLAFGFAALSAPPALAQMDSREGIELQHQLLELKRDVQNLRDQVARGGTASYAPRGGSSDSGEITAQLLQRVESLEDQVRRLRGRVDEVANQTQRQGDDLNKKIGDLNFRVQSLEPGGGGGSPPPARAQAPVASAPPPAPAPAYVPLPAPSAPPATGRRTPELALQEGSAALARRDYAAAEAAAREVLNNNKTSPRAYDAQLLLAQSLSGRKEYSQAAIAYDDAYKRNRKGTHAPDAMLGLANSLNAIGERKAACATLVDMRSEFPNPRADLKDPIASAYQRAGCK